MIFIFMMSLSIRKRLCFLSFFVLHPILCIGRATPCPETSPPSKHLELRHIEGKGIGYDQGYTTLALFMTADDVMPAHALKPVVPFFDLRIHVFDNGRPALNIGTGFRYPDKRIWGASFYYDFRQTARRNYNQLSLGFESLGKRIDFRLNGYLPVGQNKSSLFSPRFGGFQGNFMKVSLKREFSLGGVNAEMGFRINKSKKIPFYFALGPYYLTGKKSAWGGKARASLAFFDRIRLEGNVSYDSLFKWIGQGEVALTYPFGGKKEIRPKKGRSCSEELSLRRLWAQRVERSEIIPIDTKRSERIATDSAGNPLIFWFVDNQSSSAGTFESPFSTLVAAQNASSTGDIIYVFPGDGTSTGMDAGITLKNSQQLLGAGFAYSFSTQFGSILVPAQARGRPLIGRSGGGNSVIIECADNNTIAGLQINLVNNVGINISNTINGLTVNNNILSGSVGGFRAIRIAGSGSVYVTNNQSNISGFQNLRFEVAASRNMQVIANGNILTGSGATFGMGLNYDSGSTSTFIIYNNAITNSGSRNAIFIGSGAQSTTINLSNNTIDNISTNAISGSFSSSSGPYCFTIAENQMTDVTGAGVSLTSSGTLFTNIENNTFSTTSFGTNITASGASATSCIRLNNNTSTNGYNFTASGGGTLNLEPPVGNTGTITTSGTTSVSAGTCSCQN